MTAHLLPKLDWRSGHDPQSEHYRYGAIPRSLRSYEGPRTWQHGVVLDQGREGACVGFGWTAELLASPYPYKEGILGEATAFASRLYQRARQYDKQMGWNWPEGASVLGGAKSTMALGYIGQYRWCMNMDELKSAVCNEGPVVLGLPWYSGMYETRPSGLVEVTGKVVGGHCITLVGYHPGMRIAGETWTDRFPVYRWVNSWGSAYGKKGVGYIHENDLAALLDKVGEACVPMRRSTIKKLQG